MRCPVKLLPVMMLVHCGVESFDEPRPAPPEVQGAVVSEGAPNTPAPCPSGPARRAVARSSMVVSAALEGSSEPSTLEEWLQDRARAESAVAESGSSLDTEEWLQQMQLASTQVGKIQFNGVKGTAFLVGPDLVLTNHHVVRAVIEGFVQPELVRVEFEHGPPCEPRSRNESYRLAPESWLVAYSPSGPPGGETTPEAAEAELDYALLRLDGAPGVERGFVSLLPPSPDLSPGASLSIVEYPQDEGGAQRLQIAVERESVLELNEDRTRVRYRNYTLPGASGSPCFDKDWQLVAIHRAGDVDLDDPAYNEGVPIATIVEHLPIPARKALGHLPETLLALRAEPPP